MILPQEVAEKHGRFQMHYAPHLYGIFSAMDDPGIVEVDCMKAAQVAWTTALIAYLLNRICNQPCAMIALFDSDGAARDFHDEKLVPIIESTPELTALIDVRRSRTAGNRSDFKRFPGGFLKLGGSGQIRKVKSTSAGVLVVEEPDDAKDNVKDQGDAIQLLWERAKRRKNVKRIIGGTPTLKGFSQVEYRLEMSDKRVLPVECHECGEKHVLNLEHVKWEEHDSEPHPVYGRAILESAAYACPRCGVLWDDFQRQTNIRKTVMDAILKCDPYCGWVPTQESSGIAGFHELNEAYSCLPGVGMSEYVKDHLEAEHAASLGDENKRIVHINSKHGRPYEFRGDNAEKEALEAAALDYDEGTVPAGGLILAAGVDVQHDRLSVLIRAYGRDEESWLVLWHEPAAKTSCTTVDDPVWTALEKIVLQDSYPGAEGLRLRVSAMTIDSSDGQTNDAVYSWVVSMRRKYPRVVIMAGKGASSGDPEIYSTPVTRSVNPRNKQRITKADRWGLRPHMIGTNKAKDRLFSRWRLEASGEGRHHAYSEVREDYWTQITSEVKVPKRTLRGKKVYEKKLGVPNEALDCEVYAEHASRSVKANEKTAAQWDGLEAQLRQKTLFQEGVERKSAQGQEEANGTQRPAQQPSPRLRGGLIR